MKHTNKNSAGPTNDPLDIDALFTQLKAFERGFSAFLGGLRRAIKARETLGGATGQSTKIRETNPNFPEAYPQRSRVRRDASYRRSVLGDLVDASIGIKRQPESIPFPNSARDQKVQMNPKATANKPTQPDFKEDSE
jgi:hypothetical protein